MTAISWPATKCLAALWVGYYDFIPYSDGGIGTSSGRRIREGLARGAVDVKPSAANAGHNCPLLTRAKGQVERLTGHGMVMGIFTDQRYELNRTVLEAGDLLAMYSDGVTEACDGNGQELGEAGWCGESSSQDDLRCCWLSEFRQALKQ